MSTSSMASPTTSLPLSSLPPAQLSSFIARLEKETAAREARNRLATYKPYNKQREFHALGAVKLERLFIAGNQLGKTLAGAAETAMHLTGDYPDWWEGRRWDKPITVLCGSESSELTRDGVQRLLVGPPSSEEEWGTGYVPKDKLLDWSRKMGVPNTLDNITVRHKSGGVSTALFKSYDQGRTKWQAATVELVWFDEEPPLDVYSEGRTRTNATRGSVMVTFTPLLGMSDVVRRFLMETDAHRGTVTMTIDDAEHYSQEERDRIVAGYPEHEREARAKGIPIMGSGRVFPVAEAAIVCDPFIIPAHWPLIGGLDFGWDHPTAAVKLAWDRDKDVVYVVSDYRARTTTPVLHVAALKPWGERLIWAWPHDGLQHDKTSGEQLAVSYREHGLNLTHERATFDDGSNGVEAGVSKMLERMQTQRWKVFSTCGAWIEEFRLYHRKDGLIVKLNDDAISASRYAFMMLRFAEVAKEQSLMPNFGGGGGWQAS